MVPDVVLGAVVGGVLSLGGALGTAYIQWQRAEMEQEGEDGRVIAEHFAAAEAECAQELGYQFNQTQRSYARGVQRAASHMLTEDEFRTEYENEYKKLLEKMDKASIFLTERGEQSLARYINHLIDAEAYMYEKARTEDETHVREGDPKELVKFDGAELDWSEWFRDYHKAKRELKEDASSRLKLLSVYEGR